MGNMVMCVACREGDRMHRRARVDPLDDYDFYSRYSENSLLSLSSVDYDEVIKLIDTLESITDYASKVVINNELTELSFFVNTDTEIKMARQLGDRLSERYPKLYRKIYLQLHEKYNINDPVDKADKDGLEAAYRSTSFLRGMADVSIDMCKGVCEFGLIELLVSDLGKLTGQVGTIQKRDHYKDMYIRSLLGTLHNVARSYFPSRGYLRDINAVDILLEYLEGEEHYRFYAMIILTFIMNEEEIEKIMSQEENAQFLILQLETALLNIRHKVTTPNISYTAIEVLEGINMVIVNDTAKIKVMEYGILAHLVQILRNPSNYQEQLSVATSLWTLAFNEDNKKTIRAEKRCIKELGKLKHSKKKELSEACIGALWELGVKDEQKTVVTSQVTNNRHVMISYQWDDEQFAVKLKEELEASGYSVWMDMNNTWKSFSTLKAIPDTLQEAIISSDVIIMCISEAYKFSNRCRSESEFITNRELDRVAIRLQPNYTPDGWLKRVAGGEIVDLSSEKDFEKNFKELTEILGERGKLLDTETVETLGSTPPEAVLNKPVESWDSADVSKWLKENNLEHITAKFDKYNGKDLLNLRKMLDRAAQFYYDSLKNDFGFEKTIDIGSFTSALESLPMCH